ncbi:MAG: serine hydrolase [Oscillospiraceae bacterium]|nr:serine hydrolase [Oscillospiraceae bacterium]
MSEKIRNTENLRRRLGALLLCLALLLSAVPVLCARAEESMAEGSGEAAADAAADLTEADAGPADPAAQESDPVQAEDGEDPAEVWERALLELLEKHGADPETVTAGYCNLVTGEEYYFHPDEYRVSGSMYKVPLNMLFLNWAAQGALGAEETVYGYSYDELLRGTIVHSDNNMAETMWDYAGAQLNTEPGTLYHRYRMLIAPIMGEDPYNVDAKFYENNFFTARQMIHCLKELYEGGLKYDRLISAMLDAEPNKYFRLYEKRYDIAHKYGWLAEGDILYLNDCGICFTEDPIAIVMFTTGTNEPYKVLSGYCTMCCDFATEQHEARLLREEKAAEQGQDGSLSGGTSGEAAGSGSGPEGDSGNEAETGSGSGNGDASGSADGPGGEEKPQGNPAGEDGSGQEPDRKGSLPLGRIALAVLIVAAAAGAIVLLLRQRDTGIAPGYAIIAVLLTAGAVLLCFPGTDGAGFIRPGEQKPQNTAEAFFAAVKAGDADAVRALTAGKTDLGLGSTNTTAAGEAAMKALRENWEFGLEGDCAVEKTTARQRVLLRTLDLRMMEPDLKKEIRTELMKMAQTAETDELYDENGDTRPEAAEEAYDRALLSLLAQPEDYLLTRELTLVLTLTRDGWKIVPDRALMTVLSGNLG